jgi:ABC-type dipeptide/oligopeptide/nickel transport system permease component
VIRHTGVKIAFALGTLVFVLVFNFFLFRIAGDPAKDLLRNPKLTPEARAELIKDRGLDKDMFTQFRIYVKNTLTGELETSYATNRPVATEIAEAIPNTLILVGSATVISALLGSWLGVIAASRRGRVLDTTITQGSLVLYAMPEFWLGMTLIWLFAVVLGAFPTGLKSDPGEEFSNLGYIWNVIQHAALPVMALALGLLGQYVVIMRSALTDVLNEDFVATARAIGLPRWRVLRSHAVRNALLPTVTLISLNLGFVVSGAITIEALFSWPGIGQLTVNAIETKDLPMLQGIFLISSAAVILANLAADILLTYLDPRVRVS